MTTEESKEREKCSDCKYHHWYYDEGKKYGCPSIGGRICGSFQKTPTGKMYRQNDVTVIINKNDDMSEIMNIKEHTIIEAKSEDV